MASPTWPRPPTLGGVGRRRWILPVLWILWVFVALLAFEMVGYFIHRSWWFGFLQGLVFLVTVTGLRALFAWRRRQQRGRALANPAQPDERD